MIFNLKGLISVDFAYRRELKVRKGWLARCCKYCIFCLSEVLGSFMVWGNTVFKSCSSITEAYSSLIPTSYFHKILYWLPYISFGPKQLKMDELGNKKEVREIKINVKMFYVPWRPAILPSNSLLVWGHDNIKT